MHLHPSLTHTLPHSHPQSLSHSHYTCALSHTLLYLQVFFASAAPPVRFSNVYGIDIPTRTELIAHNRTEDEIGTCCVITLSAKYECYITVSQ